MQISITGRHFEVTRPIKKYISDKIAKLEKYDRKIVGAHVILSVEKFRHTAEITIVSKHLRLSCSAKTNDIYTSVDAALQKISRQLRRHWEKVKEHQPKAAPEAGREMPAPPRRTVRKRPAVIKTSDFAIKPMSVEEARLELELLENSSFLVFRNRNTDEVNVIYKRWDGNFGLIEPR